MSIHYLINDNIARGRLFQLLPRLPSAPVRRFLYASAEINRLIVGPWYEDEDRLRLGQLWEDFDRFVEGRRIAVSLDTPYTKPKSTYLARLDPGGDEVWEIRSRDPKPAIRVFGRFAEQDKLVVFNWGWRRDLGGPGSPKFATEMRNSLAAWRSFFPAHNPHSGKTVHDYVSTNTLPA